MCISVPFSHERHQAISQLIETGEVKDTQPFALYDAEPLLHLIHPRAMRREEVADEAGMRSQPGLGPFPSMCAYVIRHKNDARNLAWDLSMQVLEERDEFFLSFAPCCASVDLAGTRIKGSKQVEGSGSLGI